MIHEKLNADLAEDSLFEKAQEYALTYIKNAQEADVFPSDAAVSELSNFEEPMPSEGCSAHELLDLLHLKGSPATTMLNGGRYFGFVNGGIAPASLATKWLADAWDQNAAMNIMSPICGKLELVVQTWLAQLFNLPSDIVVGYVTGSSGASYCGLIAARFHIYQKLGININEEGMSGAPQLRIVTSQETHSSVKRALRMLGFGTNHIEFVPTDEQGRMRVDAMPDLDPKSILILQAGNVNSGSFDPIDALCDLAQAAGAWVHIDGAFGLWAGATKRFKYLTKGIEKADSWCMDGHKTLNTPYDCGIVMCKHSSSFATSLQAGGAYLTPDANRDGMYFTPDMSRRARIVDLWSTLKYLGQTGIEELVGELHDRAVQFGEEIQQAGFEVLNDIVFNQVVVAYGKEDETNQILKHIQDERICWCGGSVWKGRRVIRISVCAWMTTAEDITRSVASFKRAMESL